MKTAPRSLAESLVRAHAALLKDLRKLEEGVKQLPKLLAELAVARRHITEHFRFEEQDGYMNAVSKREPQLDRAIEELRQEHRKLEQSLEEIVREAETSTTITDSLRERIRSWVRQVEQHESRENHLVQDAFNRDTGVED